MKKKILNNWLKQNLKKNYQKHISMSKKLKKNSLELVSILKKNKILSNGMKIFEAGCGCGRNLSCIEKTGYNMQYFGNDLVKKECFRYMEDILKEKIVFIEKDTFLLFGKETHKVDLFISSDHLMHLPPNCASFVLDALRDKWKPEYILLRETSVGTMKGEKRKWVHDYRVLDPKYNYMYKKRSKGNRNYIIRLLRRRRKGS